MKTFKGGITVFLSLVLAVLLGLLFTVIEAACSLLWQNITERCWSSMICFLWILDMEQRKADTFCWKNI